MEYVVTQILQICFAESTSHCKTFICAKIIPIPKGSKPALTCSDKYRSIAISNVIGKTKNGVKQGGVISPLLFSLYIDELFLLLKDLVWHGLSCWTNIRWCVWIR